MPARTIIFPSFLAGFLSLALASCGGGGNGGGAGSLSESILYSFSGNGGIAGSMDGAGPSGALIQGRDGNLYGTTALGGANNAGAFFSVSPGGVEAVIYSASSTLSLGHSLGVQGVYYPNGLIQGSDGNFYGTNSGDPLTGDPGTIFRITPTGVATLLHSFGTGADGANPIALISGKDGYFYGTTAWGGDYGAGTFFVMTPQGNETVLYSFSGGSAGSVDGAEPIGALIQGTDGNFYGTTLGGGAYYFAGSGGTVFKITPRGQETVLFSFGAPPSEPTDPISGVIEGSDGNFYGTASLQGTYGVGAFFRITPAGQLTVLHNFNPPPHGSDCANPVTLGLGSDGAFYGTGEYGQCFFRISASGDVALVFNFPAADTSHAGPPALGVIEGTDGNFYGVGGGGVYGQGTVLKLANGPTAP